MYTSELNVRQWDMCVINYIPAHYNLVIKELKTIWWTYLRKVKTLRIIDEFHVIFCIISCKKESKVWIDPIQKKWNLEDR
jgi:hypothetical protein